MSTTIIAGWRPIFGENNVAQNSTLGEQVALAFLNSELTFNFYVNLLDHHYRYIYFPEPSPQWDVR